MIWSNDRLNEAMLKRLKAKLRIMNSICENLRESVAIPRPRVRPEFSAEFKVIQSDSKRFKPKKEIINPKPAHMYEPKWKNRRIARAHSSTVPHILMNPRDALQYEPERNSAARRPFSLSQGERAGVRASVPVFVVHPRVFSVSTFCLPRPARSVRQQIRLNQTPSQSVAVCRSDVGYAWKTPNIENPLPSL